MMCTIYHQEKSIPNPRFFETPEELIKMMKTYIKEDIEEMEANDEECDFTINNIESINDPDKLVEIYNKIQSEDLYTMHYAINQKFHTDLIQQKNKP